MSETQRAESQDPLSQGDILQLEWPETTSGPTLGIIINADCDLSHAKTDGVIAVLPIYTFNDYLARFWAAGHVSDVIAAASASVLKIIGDTDEDALHQWVKAVGAAQVSQVLSATKTLKSAARATLNHELLKLGIALNETLPAIERFAGLCKAAPNPSTYARGQISAAKKAMGEGHFFISDLIDHSSVGFVVRMRRIYTLPENDVFTSTSAQRSRSSGERVSALRVARLTPLYRFKIIQLFAQQYARIGLPDEVTALSTLAIDDLVASYTGA